MLFSERNFSSVYIKSMLFLGINSLIFWISMSCENVADKYQSKVSGHVPQKWIQCRNYSHDTDL